MNIVIVDGYTLNPGDLSWEGLEKLGNVEIHDRSTPEELLERSAKADIILTNKAPLPSETIGQLPNLKYIGVTATGYNIVDTEAASERGIPVANVPAYGSTSVAQMTFAHILNLTQRVAHYADAVDEQRWQECRDFCFWDYPLIELDGLTLGIVGYGDIGKQVAKIALAFGMEVLAYSPSLVPGTTPAPGIRATALESLFENSDIVSLHCPLTPESEKMVNGKTLSLMKPSAFLINTSRGQLIDEFALCAALEDGKIAGAGLDVLSTEPPAQENPLVDTLNCFVTPHISWATTAARSRLLDICVQNVRAFQEGNPVNVVNPSYASAAKV